MLAEGDRFALEFAAQAAEVADDVDCGLCLRAGLGAKRVPGLERNRARQLLDPCLERIGDPCEQAPTLAWDRARPGGKGIGRGWHGARDVLSVPPGEPQRSGAGAPGPRPQAPCPKRYQPTSRR